MKAPSSETLLSRKLRVNYVMAGMLSKELHMYFTPLFPTLLLLEVLP